VLDLGPASSSGLAIYDTGDAEWKLQLGTFETLADLQAFVQPINPLALATVGTLLDDPESVRYQWDDSLLVPAWVRTPETVPYAWTLTETQLLDGTDPSGIGALRDGDWGTYTPANGAPVVVRYKAACTVAAGAGGGTRPVWMIPEAYAGTPEVVAYLTGSETGVLATTLAAQGWTVTTTGSGAGQGVVSLNDGYVRCQTASSVAGGDARVISPTWLGSQRFCVQGLLRGSAAGSDPYVGVVQQNNNDIQYTFMRGNNSGVFRHFILSSATWTFIDSLNSLPNAGATPGYNLNATTPWFFQAIGRALTSATVSETVETRIDGELYGSMRRNLDAADGASAMGLTLYANGGGGGTTSTLDSKTLTILTY
jgi:hypothetical protein